MPGLSKDIRYHIKDVELEDMKLEEKKNKNNEC